MAVAVQRQLSNADARVLFLSSAIPKSQWANPGQTPATGTTLSVVLPKAGIAKGLLVTCNLPITIGTAVVKPGNKAPFNVFSNVHLQDYSGIDRVNASAYALSQLQILKKRNWEPSSLYPYVAGGPYDNAAYPSTDPYASGATYPFGLTAPYSDKAAQGGAIGPSWIAGPNTGGPSQTTFRWGLPVSVGNGSLCFSFWIPIAFDFRDPRGALLLNVPNGQVVLQLTINSNLVATTGIDTPYQSATGTVVFNSPTTANITIYTYYWDPIAVQGVPTNEYVGGIPIPYEDLQLVHEIRSLTLPGVLAASTEYIYTFQSGRDYYRVIASVVSSENGLNGTTGALYTSRVNRSRWVYDGNTPTLDEYTAGMLSRAQLEIGRELPDGMLYYDFADRPWDANSYGALGWGITTSSGYTTGSVAYVEVTSDALYLATMANA